MQYLQNCYVLDLIYKSTSLKAVKGIYDKCIIPQIRNRPHKMTQRSKR